MDRDETGKDQAQPEAATDPGKGRRPGRSWAERFEQPVKFRRFLAKGMDGRPRHFFQFDLPPGQDRLEPAVYEILKGLKFNGRTDPGLKSVTNFHQKAGTLWQLPDNPVGRTAAEVLEMQLLALAQRMEQEPDRSR